MMSLQLLQVRSGRKLAFLALAAPLLGAAPSGPPPGEAVSAWEQYAALQLVAWDGDLFAYGGTETQGHELEGGLRGGGRALLTPGPVGAYFDPNLPPGQNIPEPDPPGGEAFFHLSTWTDWLDDPGTGPVLPFDPGSGVTAKSSLYEYECEACTWLAGPISVDTRATFRVVEGDVVLHNSMQSPAIGFTRAGDIEESQTLFAQSGAWIDDWIYVDGPGETATVEVVATIQGSVDAPVEPNDFVAGIYGDLVTSDPGSLPVPAGVARARIQQRAGLYSEIQIGVAGTFPARIDYRQTLDLAWTGDTPSWSTDVRGSFDGDELVSASREIPTGEWIRVYASLDANSSCAGPLACNFDTEVELQVTSITATGGVLRSWNGIAGTIAVPEPGAAALGVAALSAVASSQLRRSRRSPR